MADRLDTIVSAAREGAETIALDLPPEGDWGPTLIMENYVGARGIVGIDPHFMTNGHTKDILATVVFPEILREFSAVSAAFISTGWGSEYRDRKVRPEDVPRPSDDPNRFEVVFFSAVTATRAQSYMSRIERHEDTHPTLGEWEQIGGSGTKSETQGRFITAIRNGLARQG